MSKIGIIPSNNAPARIRRLGVPVEMHLFEQGKHGFGIRDAQGLPVSVWPELIMAWIETKV